MTEPAPLSPSDLAGKLASLLSAYDVGQQGAGMRSAYLAKQALDDLVRDLLESGQIQAWASAYETLELRSLTLRYT